MEIVIKIDDERYKDIQRIAEVQLDRSRFQTAEQVIANGIHLPKDYGILKDANKLNLNTTCECEKCVIDKITSIKPKQGQWVQIFIPLPLSDSGKDCYCCSECRTHWDYTSNYCPNCGAKMISTSKDVK